MALVTLRDDRLNELTKKHRRFAMYIGSMNGEDFAAMLDRAIEVQALRRTARTLLDTYVGRQSGGRVLDGQIRRGTGATIRAAMTRLVPASGPSSNQPIPKPRARPCRGPPPRTRSHARRFIALNGSRSSQTVT
jgi:hypothetical protein